MKTLNEYIDDARFNGRFKSDVELSQKLGFSSTYISMIRTKRLNPPSEVLMLLAYYGGNNFESLMLDYVVERVNYTTDDYEKNRLSTLLSLYKTTDTHAIA